MTRREMVAAAVRESDRVAKMAEQSPLSQDAPEEKVKCWHAIEEMRLKAIGRRDAFEAVLAAMDGNTTMLRFHGSLPGCI